MASVASWSPPCERKGRVSSTSPKSASVSVLARPDRVDREKNGRAAELSPGTVLDHVQPAEFVQRRGCGIERLDPGATPARLVAHVAHRLRRLSPT